MINNWKILDLIEILLQLSKGEFYNSVKEIHQIYTNDLLSRLNANNEKQSSKLDKESIGKTNIMDIIGSNLSIYSLFYHAGRMM